MDTKQQQRTYVRKLKKDFFATHTPTQVEALSEAVLKKVELMPEFQRAKVVLAYNSLSDEVYTGAFLNRWHREKLVLLPKVVGDRLTLHKYEGEESVSQGAFGIGEPTTPAYENYADIDLVIVPGMAFDAGGNRLGRGRGFYDRLLGHDLPKDALLVGVCFDFQILPHVATEPNDVIMHRVMF